MTIHLVTIQAAAAELGVPTASLKTAAENHGFLIRLGRATRIDKETLPELLEKCRNAPKAPASTGTNRGESGSSATPGDLSLQQAQQIAQKLKQSSRATSRKGTGQPGQVIPIAS